MKKLMFSLSALMLAGASIAQTAEAVESRERAIDLVEASIAQPESYSQVNSIMIARLTEEASDAYTTGQSEISYSEFLERLEASTVTHVFTADNGEEIEMVNEPSLAILNDGFSEPAPERLSEETVRAYLDRLSNLKANSTEYHDYVLIGMTGGDTGLVYARLTEADGEANSISEADKLDVTIFPNPVSDMITITGLPSGNFPGKLTDMQGKEVMELTLSENKQIDLGALSAGLYTLNALVEGVMMTEMIQIKK